MDWYRDRYIEAGPEKCARGKRPALYQAAGGEWLAAMCSHVPNRREQMVRYCGWYSNILRGKRRKKATADVIPCIIESERAPAACRKSWARLIPKIYEVDPLVFPKCRGAMRIISFIKDEEIIKAILDHLGLRLIRARPPATAHATPFPRYAGDELAQSIPVL